VSGDWQIWGVCVAACGARAGYGVRAAMQRRNAPAKQDGHVVGRDDLRRKKGGVDAAKRGQREPAEEQRTGSWSARSQLPCKGGAGAARDRLLLTRPPRAPSAVVLVATTAGPLRHARRRVGALLP
jgi:hypothetical protein